MTADQILNIEHYETDEQFVARIAPLMRDRARLFENWAEAVEMIVGMEKEESSFDDPAVMDDLGRQVDGFSKSVMAIDYETMEAEIGRLSTVVDRFMGAPSKEATKLCLDALGLLSAMEAAGTRFEKASKLVKEREL